MMPLFRYQGALHYFAHVPKCGGTSVEQYLSLRFGPLGFANLGLGPVPWPLDWLKSTPQHAAWADFARVFPADWVKSSFAVVRHPLARLVSAYNMRVGGHEIPSGLSIEAFAETYLQTRSSDPFRYDNHLRAQTEFVPPSSIVFRLEDGLAAVQKHIDENFGPWSDGETIGHVTHAAQSAAKFEKTTEVSPRLKHLVDELYASDFEAFGYATEPAKPVQILLWPSVGGVKGIGRSVRIKSWQTRQNLRARRLQRAIP